MILCEFINIHIALSVGAAIGLVLSAITFFSNKYQTPNYILYTCSGILLLYALLYIAGVLTFPTAWGPFLLEVSIVLPLLILYQFRNKFIAYYRYQKNSKNKCNLAQGVETSIVSTRVLLIFAIIHFLITIIIELFSLASVGETCRFILFHIMPPLVFILTILFNQYGLRYFNKIMAHTKYISVVNDNGQVLGKVPKVEAAEYKNTYTNPVIRIIPIHDNMIFLSRRPETSILDAGKIDTPMETFLQYNETVEEGVKRLLKQTFPGVGNLSPRFVLKHSLKNEETSRLIFLFTLDIANDKLLCDCHFESGKLWTLSQIEQNIDKNYFSTCFENEFDLLQDIIDIREKYKVS
ncbi:hypothetical protein D0T60_16910 [Bacteroides sp. 224]|nr:hypothetical protein [Bacteroides sp. 224]